MSDSMQQNLNRLLDSGNLSDFNIQCLGKLFHVHKVIICPQSAVLSAACYGNFKESKISEIDLSENDPRAVEIMIRYLYSHDYQEARAHESASSTQDILLEHAAVYAIADQYLIDPLKKAAEVGFAKELEISWDSESFIHVVRELWDHKQYRDLYKIIEDVVTTHIEQLLATNAAPLISRGMKEGALSLNMLQQVIKQKNAELEAQMAQYVSLKSRLGSLKSKFRKYKEKIDDIQGSFSPEDYHSDESIVF